MTEDLNTPMLHMRLPSRGSKILRRVTMEQQKTNFDELVKELGDEIMIVEVEKMLKEVPIDECIMSDEGSREFFVSPERTLARYLVKNGIIKVVGKRTVVCEFCGHKHTVNEYTIGD